MTGAGQRSFTEISRQAVLKESTPRTAYGYVPAVIVGDDITLDEYLRGATSFRGGSQAAAVLQQVFQALE